MCLCCFDFYRCAFCDLNGPFFPFNQPGFLCFEWSVFSLNRSGFFVICALNDPFLSFWISSFNQSVFCDLCFVLSGFFILD